MRFRKPSATNESVQTIATEPQTHVTETEARPVPVPPSQTPSSQPLSVPRNTTEPPSIDSQPPSVVSEPPLPPSDSVDAASSGVKNAPDPETPRASYDTPVSPVSARASFENRRASLQQKRDKRVSMDNHAPLTSEFQSRLTVHQNQMQPFEESFPPDLIIPAEYRNLPAYPNDPKRNVTNEETPTQADFPAETPIKSSSGAGPADGLVLDTDVGSRQNSYNVPASPDYDVETTQPAQGTVETSAEGVRGQRSSSLSFIRFADVQPEGFVLKAPITPHNAKFSHESQSTFDQTAFDSPERNLSHMVSAESARRPSLAEPRRSSISATSRREGSRRRSRSATSSLRRALTRDHSKQSEAEPLDSPTIPVDTFRVREPHDQKKPPAISLFPKTKETNPPQQLVGLPKQPPVDQDVSVTQSIAVDTSQTKTSRKKQRSSLLGNLGIKGLESSPKSRSTLHKRAGTDLPRWNAPDVSAEQKLVDQKPQPESLQRSATVAQTPPEQGKRKGRFSSFSSLLNRASPRRQHSNINRSQSSSPYPKPRLESTPERPLYGATAVESTPQDLMGRNLAAPEAQPFESVPQGRQRAPSDAGQAGVDYKSVFPPEFYAHEPPANGYYGMSQDHATTPQPGHRPRQSSLPLTAMTAQPTASMTAYAATSTRNKRMSSSAQHPNVVGNPPLQEQPSTTEAAPPYNKASPNKPPSPKRETIRSIDSNLFDIETPPPPPPKDDRYTSPIKRPSAGSQRKKRNSTSTSTKVTFSGSPTVTTTTTTITKQKRQSGSYRVDPINQAKQHGRSSSSGGLVQSTAAGAPPAASKQPRSSFRQSLPPLQTSNFLGEERKPPPQASVSAAPKLGSPTSQRRSLQRSPVQQAPTPQAPPQQAPTPQAPLQQSTTVQSPTVTSTTTVKKSDPAKRTSSAPLEPAPEENMHRDDSITRTEAIPNKSISPSPPQDLSSKAPEPFPRQTSPVEKMKDEPRLAPNAEGKASPDDSEDEIVMSSTAYPGQEWRPDLGYGGWEGD